jgi:hypothetical protein
MQVNLHFVVDVAAVADSKKIWGVKSPDKLTK